MNNMFGNNWRDNKSDMDWRGRRHGQCGECNDSRNKERHMHRDHRMDNEDFRMRGDNRHRNRGGCCNHDSNWWIGRP